jgi:transposase
MTLPPPISPQQFAALPPGFQALLKAVIDYYEARIAALQAEVDELRRQLHGRTPQNSSLPPSTQHPHAKPAARKPKSNRQRGGQPGHQKHERTLIPSEQCDEVQTLNSAECRRCGTKLRGSDPAPLRHPVWEVPQIKCSVARDAGISGSAASDSRRG